MKTNMTKITFDLGRLKTARQKFLQLGSEIESEVEYANLQHSHSKLGIFLAEIFGYHLWKEIANMTSEDLEQDD